MAPLFEIRSLVYHYGDGHAALNGIDLLIHRDDRIGLVGQNGAGKTTLVKHLNGLYRPRSGAVLYKGMALSGPHLNNARLQMGMLFQDPDDQLFCGTLDEDIAFGPRNQNLNRHEVEDRVSRALRKTDLEQFRYKAPHRLSYGQKKRAAFAALLAMSPEVLLLDEPTANLDPKQEHSLLNLLQEYTGTLICISHDLLFLQRLCSRAVIMEKGSVHHDFSVQELMSDRKHLREHGLDFTFRLGWCRENGERHCDVRTHGKACPSSPPHHEEAAGDKKESSEGALIHLGDYSYRYPDGTWGIRDISLCIREGESVAIAGENGAGKSTLVSCLAGILAGKGEYLFDGKPVSGKLRKGLWRHIGMVFQDPADQLFCPSCREEVAFGPKQQGLSSGEVKARVEEALGLVRLEGLKDRASHHLSAGERRRIALASVLAMRPRVLILDEPTANLDPRGEELICEILKELDITKILISHDIHVMALLCHRTAVMHQGRIIRDYALSDLLQDDQLVSVTGLDYALENARRGGEDY